MLTRGYSGARAYCQSKLAQILFSFDLARELAERNVTVNCLHPATHMDTTMVRLSGVHPISTVEQGGAAILQLVDSVALAGRSALYFNGIGEIARRSSGLRRGRADACARLPLISWVSPIRGRALQIRTKYPSRLARMQQTLGRQAAAAFIER